MKAGWDVKPLGEVYDVRDGTHDSPKYQDEGYPLVTSKNLKPGGLNLSKVKLISKEDFLSISRRSGVSEGDLLFAMIGTIGNPTVVDAEPDFAIKNVALMKSSEAQDIYFLRYYLETKYVVDKMLREAGGTTQRFVGLGYLRKFPFPTPPLEEQKQIVAVLDAAFEGLTRAKENAEANLQNARELFVRFLEERFDKLSAVGELRTIDQIAKVKGGKRLPKGTKFAEGKTEHPYISVKNFTNDGSVDETNLGYLEPETHQAISRYIIGKDDMYISIAGTIGKTGIIPPELDGANLTENAARLIFVPEVLNAYVYYFSQTANFQDQVGINTRTAAQPKLALVRLKTVELPIVEQSTQREMVADFNEARSRCVELEINYRNKLTDIEDLRQSLLQKAFAGKLT